MIFFWCFFFYILTTFSFYRLLDNVFIKRSSFCGHLGDKKAFKETKIRGVIASKWILFIQTFFLLSQKMNGISYLPWHFCITNHEKNKVFKNFLEFRQQICHWTVLIVLGYWLITLLESSFLINFNLFYAKTGQPFAKIWKLSTVSRPFSSLKCFAWSNFETKDSFCCTYVKIKF